MSFRVALVALDGQTVPDWVPPRLAEAGIDFVARECEGREALAALAGDADVVWVLGTHRCLIAENLDVIPRCGAIIRTGSGTDNVPVREATGRGILVANTPDATSEGVSDHAIGLLLAVLRQIPIHDRAVRGGRWDRTLAWPGWQLRGRTLGLVGFGRIGQMVARKLAGFELSVLAYDPFVGAEEMAERGAEKVTLDDLLARADVVSIHCPLSDSTRHLVDERALRLMKPTAILLNTARGPIVDEVALARALREGWIAGVGLDVLEQEPPPPDHPLFELPNVVITPHIAAYAEEFLAESWRLSVETAIDLARGRWPRSCVNPEVQPRWPLSR